MLRTKNPETRISRERRKDIETYFCGKEDFEMLTTEGKFTHRVKTMDLIKEKRGRNFLIS